MSGTFSNGQTVEELRRDNVSLRERLQVVEDTLRAIRAGEVDSLLAQTPEGPRVFTLVDASAPYRTFVEEMQHGAVTLGPDGTVLFCNHGVAVLLRTPTERVVGSAWQTLVSEESTAASQQLLEQAAKGMASAELNLRRPDLTRIPVSISANPLVVNGTGATCLVITDLTERRRAEEQIKASLREKEVLLREIHHRVKNNLQIVSTLLDLQSDQINDVLAVEMFQESRGRVRAMALIHERLYSSDKLAQVDMGHYIRNLTEDLLQAYQASSGELGFVVAVEMALFPIDLAIPCGLLLNELLTNCLKHGFKGGRDGTIAIALRPGDDNRGVLTITDDGCGFPEGFDFRNSTSFGLQLVVMLVEQLHGVIELDTTTKTCFTITFPFTN